MLRQNMTGSAMPGDISGLRPAKEFWYGFEKRAMTNKKILKRYIENLLSVMKKSKDPTDRAVHQYLNKKVPGMERQISAKIREMGEGPAINWAHNVHPQKIKNMVREAKLNKHKPGWARSEILKAVAGG